MVLDPTESLTNSDEIIGSIIGSIFNGVQNGLHFIFDLLRSGQLVQSEQIFFQVQIKVAFKIAEPDRVLKDEIFKLCDVGLALDEYVVIEILNDVIQLVADDLLHVDLHFRLEIVQSVQKGTNVALQRPTSSRSPHPVDQSVKGESFFELTHVHCVFIVDQALQNLEISDHVA